ncbi:MAG: universal stress protein, partial [Deltaproteobacteria bacterium]|nr:universal stress protein [Deltaproteobacteria bacterium]
DLAKAQSASILLLAVSIEMPELEEGRYIAEKMKVLAETALVKAQEQAKAMGLTTGVETLLVTGASPAEEIVAAAKDRKVYLIVIGSRGLAAKTSSFLGSTASKVVTYSPCSVLVVKS